MITMCHPMDDVELLLLRAALESAEIPFYVHNDCFGGLYPGMQISLWNERAIRVPPSCVEDAREVIRQVRQTYRPAFADLTVKSKARILVEAIVFGWMVPAGRQKPDGGDAAKTERDDPKEESRQ